MFRLGKVFAIAGTLNTFALTFLVNYRENRAVATFSRFLPDHALARTRSIQQTTG